MEDFLLLDNALSVEEKLIRDSVREFVKNEVMPTIAHDYEKGLFRKELIPKVAKLGLLGMTLPTSVGGAGVSNIAYGLACQELEYGDSGLRSFVSVQSSLCMFPIWAFGTDEQKLRFLPSMAKGECVGCFGLTEPDAGSDPASMKTFAVKVEGGYKLSGSKMWITNATIADIAIIWAREITNGKVLGFIVEKEFSGYQAKEIKNKGSLRASNTGELVLEECFVPDQNLLPQAKGLSSALSCLTKARFGIAFGAIGAAQACYDIALNYTKERKAFGKPIASFQLIQHDLAEMLLEIVKAQAINIHLGRLMDDNKTDCYVRVSLAKMNACKEALKIARSARNILGANGISLEYHVIRHMNNLESVFTYEGTNNMHYLIVGRHITGINAFS